MNRIDQLTYDMAAVKRIHPDGSEGYYAGFLEATAIALAIELDAIRNNEGLPERPAIAEAA